MHPAARCGWGKETRTAQPGLAEKSMSLLEPTAFRHERKATNLKKKPTKDRCTLGGWAGGEVGRWGGKWEVGAGGGEVREEGR